MAATRVHRNPSYLKPFSEGLHLYNCFSMTPRENLMMVTPAGTRASSVAHERLGVPELLCVLFTVVIRHTCKGLRTKNGPFYCWIVHKYKSTSGMVVHAVVPGLGRPAREE